MYRSNTMIEIYEIPGLQLNSTSNMYTLCRVIYTLNTRSGVETVSNLLLFKCLFCAQNKYVHIFLLLQTYAFNIINSNHTNFKSSSQGWFQMFLTNTYYVYMSLCRHISAVTCHMWHYVMVQTGKQHSSFYHSS